jgi:hypothetical protein
MEHQRVKRVRFNVTFAATITALALAGVSAASAQMMPSSGGMMPASGGMMSPSAGAMTQVAGPYRLQLVVLAAEPFFTPQQVAQGHVAEGMVVIGGAAPVPPDAVSHPNHHLVVHVYDRATGKALSGAHVSMTVASAAGGSPSAVPIVEMQAVGKGVDSTHYGNNVTLAPGTYDVTVTVNGNAPATFVVTV